MLLRRIVKDLITLWTVLPIYADLARARMGSFQRRVLADRKRKVAATIVGIVANAALLASGHWIAAAILAASGIAAVLIRIGRNLRRSRQLSVLSAKSWPEATIPPAAETLRAMGVSDDRIRVLLTQGGVTDLVLASLRQRVDLVLTRGVVAVRKTYVDAESFENETLALNALRDVAGVPHIVRIDSARRVLYQSFLRGENLGTGMARAGASIDLQQQLNSEYPGSGRWKETDDRPVRARLLAAVRACMDNAAIEKLAGLLDRIHRAGVAIGEVSYGDVVLQDGQPQLCDFAKAHVYRPDSAKFVAQREAERDRLNFCFGGGAYSEAAFRAELADLAARKRDLLYAPVYYGNGYAVGPIASIELGSGKWRFIQPHLPDFRGKRILDLGTNNALLPLSMLRAGARHVTAYELDPVFAQYARATRRWFEFVDNKAYDLQLVEGPMRDVCDRDLTRFDIATSFCSLYYESPEKMAAISRKLSESVEYFIVQSNENPEQHTGELRRLASLEFLSNLLRENGFPDQRILRFDVYGRPLVIGRSRRFS